MKCSASLISKQLMEGNLRGARDLVAPLTAANLKRATSLGSSGRSPCNGRSRFAADADQHDSSIPKPMRMLHTQASSPTMGRDYNGHVRNFSGTEIPDRPHTALARSNSGLRNGRIPVRVNDGSSAHGLRSSRSHDSLGGNVARERSLRPRGSPDPVLEPLPEDESNPHAITSDAKETGDERLHGLGIDERPASQTENLREQMSSLKGKISTLKERAREDSLRRQSLMNLRTPTPLNNATVSPPEFFYMQNESCGTPPRNTDAGPSWAAQQQSPASSQSSRKFGGQPQAIFSSRNAFAEQAVRHQRSAEGSPHKTPPSRIPRKMSSDSRSSRSDPHKRTPSGTAVTEPASDRFSHHQHVSSNKYATNSREGSESRINVRRQNSGGQSVRQDVQNIYDEEGGSVYEDAEYEQPAVVAHEDRDDAFDYQHFFLHSAMGSYSGGRPSSMSSEETISSSGTARGPTAPIQNGYGDNNDDDDDDKFDPESSKFPPPTPETPERLKEIERNLHRRNFSDESVSTLATFATADEGPSSPSLRGADWPIPPSLESVSRPHSRPGTAIKRPSESLSKQRRDSSSERADSGVGLDRASTGSRDVKHRPAISMPKSPPYSAVSSPPMSPGLGVDANLLHDPATVVVNALLDPRGQPLGLKNKALLFGLVESLRKVCVKLQDEEEGQYASRLFRQRVEDARKALDGVLERDD
ncbi:hypothetical protein M433DRAFT_506273 [Acidomyces richmondensis BFW]|nr:MAG: hypothetical protein FE78DRAFT_311718 [Acidomyces sp. 'richmondensis']KYG47298.1 hypothetical protein M433DRAFT_506273 [Acidomyces richmondensis BFW]